MHKCWHHPKRYLFDVLTGRQGQTGSMANKFQNSVNLKRKLRELMLLMKVRNFRTDQWNPSTCYGLHCTHPQRYFDVITLRCLRRSRWVVSDGVRIGSLLVQWVKMRLYWSGLGPQSNDRCFYKMTHTQRRPGEARAEAGVAVPGAKNARGSRQLETTLETEWSCLHLHFELLAWGTQSKQVAQSAVLCCDSPRAWQCRTTRLLRRACV